MSASEGRGKTLVLGLILVVNISLIFFVVQFLQKNSPKAVLMSSAIVFGVGMLGLSLVALLTSRGHQIIKTIILSVLVFGTIFALKYYWDNNENIVENYFAVVVLPENPRDIDVKFAEYRFTNSYALHQFVGSVPWYMGDSSLKERKQMLDYYYAIKAEEKENNKELIQRFDLRAAVMPIQGSSLLAFVDEYREGRFVVRSNPVFNISTTAERADESQGQP